MNKRIYCISGLGADEKVFSKLTLVGCELVFLPWFMPQHNESIQDYARRMSLRIQEERPVVLGVSYGGMVAIEISKLLELEKLILVSSVTTKYALPWWMRASGKLQLHKLVQPRPHPLFYPIENYFLGTSSKSEKRMANQFRKHVDGRFVQWAINEIVTWSNVTKPANYVQIHGTGDKLFPVHKSEAAYLIKGGGHFMIYNRASEISKIIVNELQLQTQ